MKTLYKYLITYSNHFKIEDKTFAFRKRELFEISKTPTWIELKNNNGSKGYWINRKWYSVNKIKELIINKEVTVDLSKLQWYEQIILDECFNLKR